MRWGSTGNKSTYAILYQVNGNVHHIIEYIDTLRCASTSGDRTPETQDRVSSFPALKRSQLVSLKPR